MFLAGTSQACPLASFLSSTLLEDLAKDYPHDFLFLIFIRQHLGAHGSFLSLWLAQQLLGCTSQDCKPCNLASLETKERVQRQ